MTRGLFVLMLVLCTMLATRTQVGGAPSQSTLILPGVQLGPLRIGMTPKETMRIMGQRTQTYTASPTSWGMRWNGLGAVFLGKYPDGKVTRIATQSPKYRTRQGIGVGSSSMDAVMKLGDPLDISVKHNVGVFVYWGLTIEFAMDYKEGRISAIMVDAPFLSLPYR